MNFAQEIERLRRKAAECRSDALDFTDVTRTLMLKIADVYDEIADAYVLKEKTDATD